jgi:FMN reductase
VELLEAAGADTSYYDLQEFNLPMCGTQVSFEAAEARMLGTAIATASGVLLGVPIYNYDVNAAAKNLVELTGRAWTGKVVGFLCAAGGKGSYMSAMGLANSLMLDFRCVIVPRYVYTVRDDFADGQIASEAVLERVRSLCETTVKMAAALGALKLEE